MKVVKFILLLAVLKIGVSCEKVVDVSINDAENKLVIEGILKNYIGESYVKLSKSGSVYDNSGFIKVSNAHVLVSDDQGNSFQFTEDPNEKGKYIYPTFLADENTEYRLLIEVEDQVFNAVSSSRSLPKIDSITFTKESFFGSTFYQPSYHSVDNAQEVNHYRLKISINSEASNVFYLGDDKLINGKYYTAPFLGTSCQLLDTVFIEILEMDRHVYSYYYGLSNEADNSAFSPAPSNPVSNIEGDALGFFGVFMTDTASVIVQ